MSTLAFDYKDCPYPVRDDLPAAFRVYWHKLARPGNWWTGAERIAIAEESRAAATCSFCLAHKDALSPYTMEGSHEDCGRLEAKAVDAIHRVITDQSRITTSYVAANHDSGLSEEKFVELLGITVCVLSIDEFNRGLGLPLEPLPVPEPGDPNQYRPARTEHATGYVAMIPADGATGAEADLWPADVSANVLRALSLVPDAVRDWLALGNVEYLSMQGMSVFRGPNGRSIDRMQIELVAARVSSYHECFY